MKTKLTQAFIASTALMAVTLGSSAAHAATATADARARVLQVVTLTKTADLDFGTIVPGAAASTATFNAAGTFTCGAGLTCTDPTASRGRAVFTVNGTDGETVNLSSDASVVISSGGNNMTVDNMAPNAATQVLTAGVDAFQVHGRLNVGINQAEGNYVGTFNVTVNY